jgi:hypothetical protein
MSIPSLATSARTVGIGATLIMQERKQALTLLSAELEVVQVSVDVAIVAR